MFGVLPGGSKEKMTIALPEAGQANTDHNC